MCAAAEHYDEVPIRVFGEAEMREMVEADLVKVEIDEIMRQSPRDGFWDVVE